MRNKPEGADAFGWAQFEQRADIEGFGEHEDDWGDWWSLWMEAYQAGALEAEW